MFEKLLTRESSEDKPPVVVIALKLAAEGFAVFPVHAIREAGLCTCREGTTCKHPGKHPRTRRGLLDATADSAKIEAWWKKWPNARIGVVPASGGCVVIDVDLKGGKPAVASLDKFKAEYGERLLENTFYYVSPSGGFHAWLRLPPDATIRSGNNLLGEFIDVKSSGGYVVFWAAHGHRANGRPIQDAPPALVERLRQGNQQRPKFDRERALAGVPLSQRNEALFGLACSDRGRRVPIEESKANLRHAAAACDPPWDGEPTDKIVERVYARYPEPGIAHPYFIGTDDCFHRFTAFDKDGKPTLPKRIADHSLEIVFERHLLDGEREVSTEYALSAPGISRTPVVIPADQFNKRDLDRWHFRLGRDLTIAVGETAHYINAVRKLSLQTKDIAVYRFSGWHKIQGNWIYLHPGRTDVCVEYEDPKLDIFRLPPPADTPEGRRRAARALLDLRLISAKNPLIGYTALSAVLLSLLGFPPDLVILFNGPSGTFKSAVAAAIQNCFSAGAPWRFNRLPANWGRNTTALGLRLALFQLKDMIFVVDELRVRGSKYSAAAANEKFESLVSAVADSAVTRHSDIHHKSHTSETPRGILLATGEQIHESPGGTAGRVWAVRFAAGDVSLDVAERIHLEDAPLYALASREFTDWLAPQFDRIHALADAGFKETAARVPSNDLHLRTPAIIGKLYTALQIGIEWAQSVGALSAAEAGSLLDAAWTSFQSQGIKQQQDVQHEVNEVEAYFELTRAAREGGAAHLTTPDGGPPIFAGSEYDDGIARDYTNVCGWEIRTFGSGENERTEPVPKGRLIGYIWPNRNGTAQVGYHPVNSYAEAQFRDREGNLLPRAELGRRLVEFDRLAKHENRGKNAIGTAQKKIKSVPVDLFWVRVEDVFGAEPRPAMARIRGDWSPEESYKARDGVAHCGRFYFALAPNHHVEPGTKVAEGIWQSATETAAQKRAASQTADERQTVADLKKERMPF